VTSLSHISICLAEKERGRAQVIITRLAAFHWYRSRKSVEKRSYSYYIYAASVGGAALPKAVLVFVEP
jgi:hypothetical protein